MRIFIDNNINDVSKTFSDLEKKIKREERDFISDVSKAGFESFRLHAPVKTGTLKRRIKREPLVKTITGYSRTVGIKPNDNKESNLPTWLHWGTGLWGTFARPISAKNGKYMTFKIGHRWVKVKQIRGMKRNPFWDNTIRDTNSFATIRARTLFNNITQR